jgi:hypothetical protein
MTRLRIVLSGSPRTPRRTGSRSIAPGTAHAQKRRPVAQVPGACSAPGAPDAGRPRDHHHDPAEDPIEEIEGLRDVRAGVVQPGWATRSMARARARRSLGGFRSAMADYAKLRRGPAKFSARASASQSRFLRAALPGARTITTDAVLGSGDVTSLIATWFTSSHRDPPAGPR